LSIFIGLTGDLSLFFCLDVFFLGPFYTFLFFGQQWQRPAVIIDPISSAVRCNIFFFDVSSIPIQTSYRPLIDFSVSSRWLNIR
jgi:hypothetical protein